MKDALKLMMVKTMISTTLRRKLHLGLHACYKQAYVWMKLSLNSMYRLLSVPEDSPFLQRVIEAEPIAAA